MIRKAIDDGKSSIKIQLDSQREYRDRIINLQDHEYKLLGAKIIKKMFPLTSEMTLDFGHDVRVISGGSMSIPDTLYYDHYVIISWDKIEIKKQDVMRCREYTETGESLQWKMCETTKDVIVYERLVQFQKRKIMDEATLACEGMGIETTDLKPPKWNGIIPKFTGDDSDFVNLGCNNDDDTSDD